MWYITLVTCSTHNQHKCHLILKNQWPCCFIQNSTNLQSAPLHTVIPYSGTLSAYLPFGHFIFDLTENHVCHHFMPSSYAGLRRSYKSVVVCRGLARKDKTCILTICSPGSIHAIFSKANISPTAPEPIHCVLCYTAISQHLSGAWCSIWDSFGKKLEYQSLLDVSLTLKYHDGDRRCDLLLTEFFRDPSRSGTFYLDGNKCASFAITSHLIVRMWIRENFSHSLAYHCSAASHSIRKSALNWEHKFSCLSIRVNVRMSTFYQQSFIEIP